MLISQERNMSSRAKQSLTLCFLGDATLMKIKQLQIFNYQFLKTVNYPITH